MMVEATDFEVRLTMPPKYHNAKHRIDKEAITLLPDGMRGRRFCRRISAYGTLQSLDMLHQPPTYWAPDLCLRIYDSTSYPSCTYITKRLTRHHPRRAIKAICCSQQCLVTTSDKHIMSTGCFYYRRTDLQCEKQIRPSRNTTRDY
jgi:hypothetical protein